MNCDKIRYNACSDKKRFRRRDQGKGHHLLGIIGGDFESVAADLIGGKRECFARGRLQRDSALKGTKRD